MIRLFIDYIRYFLKQLKEHAVSAYAAQAAFFIILSFFPFIMFLMTLIRYLPVTEDMLISLTNQALPSHIGDYIVSLLNEIYGQSSAAIISITIITAIWSASKGIMAVIRGFNSIYGIYETRNYLYLRLISSFYTVIFAISIVGSLILLVFGNRLMLTLTRLLSQFNIKPPVIISFRVLIALIVLFFFFLAMYIFVPNRKSTVSQEAPGALLTTISWAVFSSVYSYYIDNFANFDTYGSLTTIVFLMLWLYFCMYILFIGSEVNVFIQEQRYLL
ncbi:MAG: YihY/virulence factor BrkB family protein [Acetivibrio ethanolgignens]